MGCSNDMINPSTLIIHGFHIPDEIISQDRALQDRGHPPCTTPMTAQATWGKPNVPAGIQAVVGG